MSDSNGGDQAAAYQPVRMAEEATVWTHFYDMHSGGGTKEPPYQHIYIEAPEDEAKVIFYNRFGHNPERVTCTCCGSDYSISEDESLAAVTAFQRNCRHGYRKPDGTPFFGDPREALGCPNYLGVREAGWTEAHFEEPDPERVARYSSISQYVPLDAYLQAEDVLVLRADDIKPEERVGGIPEQGYVWVGDRP